MKQMIAFSFLALTACEIMAGVPEVSNVTIAQPRRKTIEVSYTLQNGPAIVTVDFLTNGVSVGADKIVNNVTGAFEKVSAATQQKIRWNVGAALPNVRNLSLTAVVKAWALENPPDYLVLPLSTKGKTSPRYYPSEAFLPGASALDTRYRTTHLLMKKVMAKGLTWTMGGDAGQSGASRKLGFAVTLTNNYYLGVFELTQKQTENVGARKGVFTKDGDMRPTESISFDCIRDAKNWESTVLSRYPACPYVDPDGRSTYSSLIGCFNLCANGLTFDLPTEAQWEFAARAGQPPGRWGNGDACFPKYESSSYYSSETLGRIARYISNGRKDSLPAESGSAASYATYDTTLGTQICGSYPPNAYGFYDMHGNVSEYVLDWWDANNGYYAGKEYGRPNCDGSKVLSTGANGSHRTLKGGSWMTYATQCMVGSRYSDYGTQYGRPHFGVRLCLTLP